MRLKKYRKVFIAVAAVLTASAMTTGTLAWKSISQEALNETVLTVNPGGRLHDDFNGENKDVYVENFFSEAEGGVPIFVRIRLYEYMETGKDAGVTTKKGADMTDQELAQREVNVIGTGQINKKDTWTPYKPTQTATDLSQDASRGDYADYWKWTLGGETVYMPTYNKNKDSLAADINGTWEGTTKGDNTHFDDYKDWKVGDTTTGDEVRDADSNDIEEASPVEGTNIKTDHGVTHTAKKTSSAAVMTMKQWLAMGAPIGNYWVWDEDGWAYWAAPLAPGATTGLLLDGIDMVGDLSDDCYYAINVVAQFATKEDWGSKTNPVGFYDPNGYHISDTKKEPTDDALFLLNQAADKNYTVSVTPEVPTGSPAVDSVVKGQTQKFTASVECMNHVVTGRNQTVTWSVNGQTSDSTTIDNQGVLTVGADETAAILDVVATSANGTVGKFTINVKEQ